MLHLAQQLAVAQKLAVVTKSGGMALVRQGDRRAPWSNFSSAFLAIQNWTGQLSIANRICKDAFDWHTRGSAGDGRGLNSAWWMAWPSRPGWPGAQGSSARASSRLRLSCRSLCHTIVNKICSVLIGSLPPGLPRISQGILTTSVKAGRILHTIIEASRSEWEGQV